MRSLLLPLLLLSAPAAAQVAVPAPAAWDPAAPYITAGQDEPGYRSWYMAAPWRAGQVKAFNDYLADAEVAGVVPTWQLLRTATAWQECGGQPFEIAPTSEWPHMVQTLRYIRDYVIPVIGAVEPVSVYRNPILNVCAGGAPESAHMHLSAVDLVPLNPTTREALMRTLCGTHSLHGEPYGAGLGFYAYLRFHIDSTKFRRWNMDPAVAAECPPIVHPSDVATIGQPLPQPAVPQTAGPSLAAPQRAEQPQPAATLPAAPAVPAAPTQQEASPR